MRLSLTCPNCGTPVPLSRTQWRAGTPFECRSCYERLVIPRSLTLGVLAIGSVPVFYARADGVSEKAIVVGSILLVLMVLSRIFMLPRRVGTEPASGREPSRE